MENNCSEGSSKVANGGNKPKTGLLTNNSQFKAKRTVSFKDQCANQSLYTVHHVESLKRYNAEEEKGFSCLKCFIL